MTEKNSTTSWKSLGQSIRGVAHVKADLPNQDALLVEQGSGELVIFAIADGHGSAKSFRSDFGARLSVGTAIEVARRFAWGDWTGSSLSIIKQTIEERIPREVVRLWQGAVLQHVADHPFEEQEIQKMVEKDGPTAIKALEKNPLVAYGATLLLLIATAEYVGYLQLGDGDILTVSTEGVVARPLLRDERLIANETTSLSAKQAWKDFRTSFQVTAQGLPALILLSTDGYANSFLDEAAFLQVGKDFLELLRSERPAQLMKELAGWLQESSEKSGDDVTLGLVYQTTLETSAASDPFVTEENLPSPLVPNSAPPLTPEETKLLGEDSKEVRS